jgi:hypothetical protein
MEKLFDYELIVERINSVSTVYSKSGITKFRDRRFHALVLQLTGNREYRFI